MRPPKIRKCVDGNKRFEIPVTHIIDRYDIEYILAFYLVGDVNKPPDTFDDLMSIVESHLEIEGMMYIRGFINDEYKTQLISEEHIQEKQKQAEEITKKLLGGMLDEDPPSTLRFSRN